MSKTRTDNNTVSNKALFSSDIYKKMVEEAVDGFAIIQKRALYFVNQNLADILGYNREEMLGKNYMDFVPKEEIERAENLYSKFSASENPIFKIETRLLKSNGEYLDIEMNVSDIEVNGEKAALMIVRDITGRKSTERELLNYKDKLEELVNDKTNKLIEANKKLRKEIDHKTATQKELKAAKEAAEESSRLKSSLLANMSHEFRTPMNGIIGYAKILKDKTTDEYQQNAIEKILFSSKRLLSTLNSVLEISRLESGTAEINMSEIHLISAVEFIAGEYRDVAESKELEFNIDKQDDKICVVGDESMLTQILHNLMHNAVKYTEKGEINVQVSSRVEKGSLLAVLRVSDTGIGIDEDYLELIFQEFRQVSEGINRRYEGIGLGLALTKKMTELMNGSIEVESAPGRGSTFIVRLPGVHLNTLTETLKTDEHTTGNLINDILLVDDSHLIKEIASSYLEGKYTIDYAKDGRAALKLAEEKIYDLILMDINLGAGLNGIETARLIKKINGYDKTPIIAVTGYAMREDRDALLSEGFTSYIKKPFEKDDLLSLINSLQ